MPAFTQQTNRRISDPGTRLLGLVIEELGIEPEWAVHDLHHTSWWPGQLAQHIFVEDDASGDTPTVTVHVVTDFLKNAPNSPETAVALGRLNTDASLSALVWNRDTGHVRLHCSFSFPHERITRPAAVMVVAAATLQLGEVTMRDDAVLQTIAGAQLDTTRHPTSGPRTTPHRSYENVLVTLERGEEPSAFIEALDFRRLLATASAPWVSAASRGPNLVLQIPFVSDTPVDVNNLAAEEQIGVGLLHVRTDIPHPVWGNGLLLKVMLPMPPDPDYTDRLNQHQARNPWAVNSLGAWAVDGAQQYSLFLPNLLALRGFGEQCLFDLLHRIAWLRAFLLRGAA